MRVARRGPARCSRWPSALVPADRARRHEPRPRAATAPGCAPSRRRRPPAWHASARGPRSSRSRRSVAASGTCGVPGRAPRGRTWWKIASVNGKTAQSQRYHQQVRLRRLDACSTRLPVQLQAACGGVAPAHRPARPAPRPRRGWRTGARVTATWAPCPGGNVELPTAAAASPATAGTGSPPSTASACGPCTGSSALYAARGLLKARDRHRPAAARDQRLHRGHRRQPLAGHDRLGAGRGRGQAVRVHEGLRLDRLRRPDLRHQPGPGEARRASRSARTTSRARTPASGDAVAEADHFIATAAWGSGDLLPVLDLETTGGLSVAKLQAWVAAFLGRIYDRTGRPGDDLHARRASGQNKMGDTQAFAAGGLQVAVDRALDDEPVGDRARRRTGPATAGRSGSTRRTGACRASPAASTSTATTARTSGPSRLTLAGGVRIA